MKMINLLRVGILSPMLKCKTTELKYIFSYTFELTNEDLKYMVV